jgi:hypothetical protein
MSGQRPPLAQQGKVLKQLPGGRKTSFFFIFSLPDRGLVYEIVNFASQLQHAIVHAIRPKYMCVSHIPRQ